MTDLEAVITASERTLEYLRDMKGRSGAGFTETIFVLIKREEFFLAKLRELQRGIYG